jgi:7-keto-8-aminopelargonate synthetase-like enzyme
MALDNTNTLCVPQGIGAARTRFDSGARTLDDDAWVHDIAQALAHLGAFFIQHEAMSQHLFSIARHF